MNHRVSIGKIGRVGNRPAAISVEVDETNKGVDDSRGKRQARAFFGGPQARCKGLGSFAKFLWLLPFNSESEPDMDWTVSACIYVS